MSDRRFELRVRRGDPVEVLWEDRAGQSHHSTGYLADISRSGASVGAQCPVHIGTTISLVYQNQKLSGKVKYCALRRPGYLLGIEFQAGAQD